MTPDQFQHSYDPFPVIPGLHTLHQDLINFAIKHKITLYTTPNKPTDCLSLQLVNTALILQFPGHTAMRYDAAYAEMRHQEHRDGDMYSSTVKSINRVYLKKAKHLFKQALLLQSI
jgi:hypothetical protein